MNNTGKFLIILLLTALAVIGELTLIDRGSDWEVFIYLTLSQLFAPLFIAAVLVFVIRLFIRTLPRTFYFILYLFLWIAEIILSYVLIFNGTFQGYI